MLLGLRFNQLSWDHSYPEDEGDSHILWLEFDGEEDGTPVNKLLKIYSKQVRKSCWGSLYRFIGESEEVLPLEWATDAVPVCVSHFKWGCTAISGELSADGVLESFSIRCSPVCSQRTLTPNIQIKS